jgi:chaperonin cofactor prefoldin
MLLGMAQSQGQDIRQMKADVDDMKERLAGIESRLERMETHFDERLDALMAMMKSMQPLAGQ